MIKSLVTGALAALAVVLPASADPAPDSATDSGPSLALIQEAVGEDVDLSDKVVYVDFWASWCGPCRRSFPWLSTVAARHAEDGLAIVAVNLDQRQSLAEAFLTTTPVPGTVVFDPEGKIATAFEVEVMPTAYVFARDGALASVHRGFSPAKTAEVEKELSTLLAETVRGETR